MTATSEPQLSALLTNTRTTGCLTLSSFVLSQTASATFSTTSDPWKRAVKFFTLRRMDLQPEGFAQMVEALKRYPEIRKFAMDSSNPLIDSVNKPSYVSDAEWMSQLQIRYGKALYNVLSGSFKKLERLILGNVRLSYTSMLFLARGLKENESVVFLGLKSCHIGDKHMVHLCQNLQQKQKSLLRVMSLCSQGNSTMNDMSAYVLGRLLEAQAKSAEAESTQQRKKTGRKQAQSKKPEQMARIEQSCMNNNSFDKVGVKCILRGAIRSQMKVLRLRAHKWEIQNQVEYKNFVGELKHCCPETKAFSLSP